MTIDMSVEIAGVKFANPILPGPSELVSTVTGFQRMIDAGVGGLTTKSYTSLEGPRVRMHPNFFVLRDRGFEQAGAFYSFGGGNWPEHIDVIIKRDIPQFKRMCDESGLPLMVSWYAPMEIVNGKLKKGLEDIWVQTAKKIKAAGADLQELNFSCPLISDVIKDFPWVSVELSEAVCNTGVIAGIKISPIWEPLERLAEDWSKAGVKFIAANNVAFSGLVIDVESEMPKYAPGIGSYLPGRAFLPWSLSRVARLCKAVNVPVIGVGGVHTVEDALQYLLCGASIVEICSAAYFRGPQIFTKVIKGIENWMEKKGYTSIQEFRGKALPHIFPTQEVRRLEKYPHTVAPELPYAPVVDEEKCSLCRMCEACIFGVYKVQDDKLVIDESKCQACGFCITLCPKGALALVDKRDKARVIWDGKATMPTTQKEILNHISGRQE